jgi:hypothetical protein
MFVWVWNISVTYHDVPDLHQRLNECMYVRMHDYMSTPLYVHVTHTQHTHAHTHNTNTWLGLYVCIFSDYVKGNLYVQRALQCTDWLLLGQYWN